MANRVRTIVITGYGTNCEVETAHACRLAGSDTVDICHISELLWGEKRLDDYDFLNLPGGFLDGDDLGAAKAGAHRILHARVRRTGERLFDQLRRFIEAGKLILGVCNGFQLMVKLGLLPGWDGAYDRQRCTLIHNDSGRFEDRWVYLKVNPASPCVFTRGLTGLYLPVRHGEGKFIPADEGTRERLHKDGNIAVFYSDPLYRGAVMDYPANPNGSVDAVAGICDPSGRLFGLMPHPEAYLHRTNHPRWTREELPEEGMGLAIFKNAVAYLRERGT
ncbi:MAG TPA: phosphoribosylformylglycinamidine synthase subunit PurQ [Syntrophales bacterium]|nr:phosphoribosylformylglycinamidine synthase subunit PurQ [Syntrophales bacterium]HOM06835.1 phosphoribosylformylglycinamidine synthase subunit PurQ [Syntrophales bacterium]HON99353.1 phosphoribosylformylglycinamidine synthase subunit PurQ [Syntrophales bacterium]HPC00611.1 phosphoribosylformylglycinamidine synthase subunit PurQ [Syntrophales bacterium]HPQ06376.1 phosphoribosylformylglycinamidine synthase subunit PurQ [Syntrophales bacterium]